jgi:hypothetical protein
VVGHAATEDFPAVEHAAVEGVAVAASTEEQQQRLPAVVAARTQAAEVAIVKLVGRGGSRGDP